MNEADKAVVARYTNLRYQGTQAVSGSGLCEVLSAHGDNPFCGDTLDISLAVDTSDPRGIIQTARYNGYGCSLCMATADLLMELIEGKTVQEARAFDTQTIKHTWGGLEVGKSRENCVSLPLRVLHEALDKATPAHFSAH